MALLEQQVTVKAMRATTGIDKIMVRYECEHETFAFILSKEAAMQMSGMLENAVREMIYSREYEEGISI
jgi:hypothetical protein